MAHQDNPSAPSAGSVLRPAVVCLAPDLFFATRLADVIAASGGRPVMAETPETFVDAIDRTFPVLALLDLAAPGDWVFAVQRCKNRPHTRQVPIYAFGSHVDVATLKAARQAGVDHAWARSKMMAELVDVVRNHVTPPVRYPDGWDDDLSDAARRGVEALNAGDYFEQHEFFEEAWLAESRPIRELYQGLLQVGVAFLLIQRNNLAGALKLFRRGLPRLRDLPPICQGIDLAAFRTAATAVHDEVTALGAERLAHFDQRTFPRIELVNRS
ncbi:MAG: DUF309 domain-containing protein [Caldilineaceae bacterium]|nr:DUF309 domain-containing protein [Caldilineaceae bacterium]